MFTLLTTKENTLTYHNARFRRDFCNVAKLDLGDFESGVFHRIDSVPHFGVV